jgi:ParB/RepB/Spo0J family partition protein
MTTIAPTAAGAFEIIPLEQLFESPWNTRKHFDEVKLGALAENIKKQGIITPLVARPKGMGEDDLAGRPLYELAAGHRRYRAAIMAGVEELPVMVREMDDVAFLEVLQIENLQREDIHPFEEAAGYVELMKRAEGYNPGVIAEKVGKSEKYVYDRIKLLQLIPALREVFLENKITAGHAIILARLSPADQKRAMDYQHGGLWTHEDHGQTDLAEFATTHELRGFGAVKPRSVRELQGWVDRHVRFEPEAADPILFPETRATISAAIEQREKVVHIMHSHQVHPTAKDPDGQRTYGPQSWQRADGRFKSKECANSVVGVIVVGDGKGDSFRVCIDKKKCKTHWGAEIAAREKSEAAGSSKPATPTAKAPAQESWEVRQARERREQEEKKKAFEPIREALVPALVAHIKKAPAGGRSHLAQLLIEDRGADDKDAAKLVPIGISAEDLVRYLAFQIVFSVADNDYYAYDRLPGLCKDLGFDYAKFAKSVKPAPEKPAAKKVAKKKVR